MILPHEGPLCVELARHGNCEWSASVSLDGHRKQKRGFQRDTLGKCRRGNGTASVKRADYSGGPPLINCQVTRTYVRRPTSSILLMRRVLEDGEGVTGTGLAHRSHTHTRACAHTHTHSRCSVVALQPDQFRLRLTALTLQCPTTFPADFHSSMPLSFFHSPSYLVLVGNI